MDRDVTLAQIGDSMVMDAMMTMVKLDVAALERAYSEA